MSFPGLAKPLDTLKIAKNGYFPVSDLPSGIDGPEEWYARHLRAMKEPSLILGQVSDNEIYRFLWLRTFHHPVAVRIEKSPDSVKLFYIELDGKGGYDSGNVYHLETKAINNYQWCSFISLLEKADFWKMGPDKPSGYDGSQWVLEGVRNGYYRKVDRWTPGEGEYRKACIFLLEAAGIDTQKLGADLY